jgi:hypothetical protein
MKLPFTPEQFFEVFRQYNEAVWPTQLALNLVALIAIGLLVAGLVAAWLFVVANKGGARPAQRQH